MNSRTLELKFRVFEKRENVFELWMCFHFLRIQVPDDLSTYIKQIRHQVHNTVKSPYELSFSSNILIYLQNPYLILFLGALS